ncbi:MAG TPA: hypothetical protein VMJ34_07915 [Bryobacteraceae bacterium]|nr:hypothetical protein [Bryobacteraceae bacterium]
MKKLLLSLCLLLLPLSVAAADISGKWSGAVEFKAPDGTVQTMPVTAEFKQDGKTVTGTAGQEGQEQFSVDKGTIDGDRLTFEVEAPDGLYSATLTIAADDQIKGDIVHTDQNGDKITATMTLAKAKS